jgi:hypothetical protein
VTRFTTPEIMWIAKANVLYDVAVADPADEAAPARKLRGVKPPVKLEQLESTMRPELTVDRIYLVVVRESAQPDVFGAERFLTADSAERGQLPGTPGELMAEAVRALSKTPARTGDAWLALSRLPPPWQNSELGVRLRAQAASKLGDEQLLAEIKSAVKKR